MKSIIDLLKEWKPVSFWIMRKWTQYYNEKWAEIWEQIDNHNLWVEKKEKERDEQILENQTINFLKQKKAI
jgi:hypothetical protein